MEFGRIDHKYEILPPSIHLETEQPYQWLGNEIIEAPRDLVDLIIHWIEYEPIASRANPEIDKLPTEPTRQQAARNGTIKLASRKTNVKGGFCPKGINPEVYRYWIEHTTAAEILADNIDCLPTKDPVRMIYAGSTTGNAGIQVNTNGTDLERRRKNEE